MRYLFFVLFIALSSCSKETTELTIEGFWNIESSNCSQELLSQELLSSISFQDGKVIKDLNLEDYTIVDDEIIINGQPCMKIVFLSEDKLQLEFYELSCIAEYTRRG